MKSQILKNYLNWVVGTKEAALALHGAENISDIDYFADIARSGNEEDFHSCAFDGIKHEWLSRNLVVIENTQLNWDWTAYGLEVSVYQNEDTPDNDEIFLLQKEKYDFKIDWWEFDETNNLVILEDDEIILGEDDEIVVLENNLIIKRYLITLVEDGASDWEWHLYAYGDEFVVQGWVNGKGERFSVYSDLNEAKRVLINALDEFYYQDDEARQEAINKIKDAKK
jgi:hypothetical protein